MKISVFAHVPRVVVAAALVMSLAGCAATITQSGLEDSTAMAIGREVGTFTISERTEGTGGRIDYNVNTTDGAKFRCLLYSATGFQQAMSFGQTPNSGAVCTEFGKNGEKAGPTSNAPCNELLRAAGRCK